MARCPWLAQWAVGELGCFDLCGPWHPHTGQTAPEPGGLRPVSQLDLVPLRLRRVGGGGQGLQTPSRRAGGAPWGSAGGETCSQL